MIISASSAAGSTVNSPITREHMIELLRSQGAQAELGTDAEGDKIVSAHTPVGDIEVRLLTCHERPSPCGYVFDKRYSQSQMHLSDAQLNDFNSREGFGYAHRSQDGGIVLSLPFYMGSGVGDDYILSTFGLVDGVAETFEAFAVTPARD
jgi:hypothetical protein